jgi:hypothetical protein
LYAATVDRAVYHISDGGRLTRLQTELRDETRLIGLAVSDSRVFLLDAGRSVVYVLDGASGAVTAELPLDQTPVGFVRIRGGNVLVDTERSSVSQPMLILKTQPEPAIYFVPAGGAQ